MATWGGSHDFSNLGELQFSIGSETSEILEYVMENKALPVLRDIIREEVYSYKGDLSSHFWDGRTEGFLKSWKIEVQKQGFYNKIILFPDDYLYHLEDGGDEEVHRLYSASDLAEVIDKGWRSKRYRRPPYGYPVMYKRPFWEEFMKWMKENFEKEFLAECNRRGINMTIANSIDFV